MVALLNGGSQVVEKYTYDAFGKPTIKDYWGNVRSESAAGNRFMFTGREWIPELGIYDYRNRMYQPELGRFLQVDPIGFDAGDMNLFRYCGDDPVDRSDPMGLEGEVFNHVEDAIALARVYVKEAAFARNAAKVHVKIAGMTRHFVPSKMVPVLRHGRKFEVGPVISGRIVTGIGSNGARYAYEVEDLNRDQQRRLAASIHSHNDRSGIARPKWSSFDKALPLQGKIVERMDESDRSEWHRREPAQNRQGYREYSIPDAGTRSRSSGSGGGSSESGGSGSSSNHSSAPNAAEVDAAHQATGVPSLGAEAINFAPGRP